MIERPGTAPYHDGDRAVVYGVMVGEYGYYWMYAPNVTEFIIGAAKRQEYHYLPPSNWFFCPRPIV